MKVGKMDIVAGCGGSRFGGMFFLLYVKEKKMPLKFIKFFSTKDILHYEFY